MKKIALIAVFIGIFSSFAAAAAVLPLLSTTWNQGCYYNADCPVMAGGPCGRAYTGCNATALAQIMRFWQHPASAWGGQLTSGIPPATVDFDAATYNWLSMPASLSAPNGEVAKIMQHAGVAVDMTYGSTVSNSFFNSAALKKYFKYSLSQNYVLKPADNAAWRSMLKAELDAGRVIFVKGNDHFYLVDGYNASDNFHCNFGWGGVYDGYYDIISVIPGGYNVTPGSVVLGIKPLTGLEAAPNTINVTAGAAGNIGFEFATLNTWTMASGQAWIIPAAVSGTAGYFDWQTGAQFSVLANPGYTDRYGSITITSGPETAVINVIQAGIVPVLAVTPSLLNYAGSGGSLTVTVSCETGWTATTAETWISLLPPSGIGNGSVCVTTDICGPVSRTGSVLFTRGSMTRTVQVDQAAWGATWCVPALVTGNANGVTRVAFNTLDRVSAWNEGYVYTGMGTTINAGSSYNLNVTFYGSNAPAVWIDWNQNGLFTDPGEAVMPPAGSWYPSFAGLKTISVAVPSAALDGLTRMRVYAKTFGTGPASGPCATTENGGCIEDYDIFVINPPTPTFTATVTETSTVTPTGTPPFVPEDTYTMTVTPSVSFTVASTNTATAAATASFTRTFTGTSTTVPTNTDTGTFTATQTRTATVTNTQAATGTFTVTITTVSTAVSTGSATATEVITQTYTVTITPTLANTSASTPTFSPTFTLTPTGTHTGTMTVSRTLTATGTTTPTVTATGTSTETPTITMSHTASPPWTATITATVTETGTYTSTPSVTQTSAGTFTPSATGTITETVTPVDTASGTETPVNTMTATRVDTVTSTPPNTITVTQVNTITATPSITLTSTLVSSATGTITATFTITSSPVISATPTVTPTSPIPICCDPPQYTGNDQILVYPNPASTMFSVGVKDLMAGDKAVLTVYSSAFRKIKVYEFKNYDSHFSAHNFHANASLLSNGAYYVLMEIFDGKNLVYRGVKPLLVIK